MIDQTTAATVMNTLGRLSYAEGSAATPAAVPRWPWQIVLHAEQPAQFIASREDGSSHSRKLIFGTLLFLLVRALT